MAQLRRPSIATKPALSGVIDMAREKKKADDDVVVYLPKERVSLEGMSPDDFYERFRDFARLLVEKKGRTVLAASRSGDCPRLRAAYRKDYPAGDELELIYWSGPKSLARTAKTKFVNIIEEPSGSTVHRHRH